MSFTTTIEIDGEEISVDVDADVYHDEYGGCSAEITAIAESCGDRTFDTDDIGGDEVERLELRAVESERD